MKDSKYLSAREESRPFIYFPLLQNHETGMTLHVRTVLDPAAVIGTVRAAVQAIDRNLPLVDVRTMSEHIGLSLLPDRLGVILFGVFASLALLLAAIGTYGVMSYSVAQRTREIGIRMALGARHGDVVRMVVGRAMLLALVGVVIGLGASLGLTRLAASLLFGVSPTDPATFAAVAGILAIAALIASYIPARRAAKVDPMVALWNE